jgi:hypothetical protein
MPLEAAFGPPKVKTARHKGGLRLGKCYRQEVILTNLQWNFNRCEEIRGLAWAWVVSSPPCRELTIEAIR